MRTCSYVDVLYGSADLAGLDRNDISTIDFKTFRQLHAKRLQTAWEFNNWPDLMRDEKRYFRALYSSATTYAAGDEVFFPATQTYFQALTATTGNAPSSSINGQYQTNTLYWADSLKGYTGDAYDAATDYVQGDVVYSIDTDRYYQLFATSSIGNPPSDTSKWGLLTEFDAYISYDQPNQTAIGEVHYVGSVSMRLSTRGREYSTWLSNNGIQVATVAPWAWIHFKIRCPLLKGDNFSATTVYIADEDQVYYNDDFYDVVTTTTAGDTPDSAPAKFSIVQIPLIFQRYLEMGGYADYLRADGQEDKSTVQNGFALEELSYQKQLLEGPEGQTKRTLVLTR